jgi:hypothetical protein
MSYAPRTLFRLSDKYTAVLLKDGSVFEVKNKDTNTRSKYESLEAWKAAHPDLPLTTDTSKAYGIVIGSDTYGFNYPTEKHEVFKWVQWLYSMLCEAAPHLLKNEELKTLYNKMVELVSQQKGFLDHCYSLSLSSKIYSIEYLNWQPTRLEYRKEVPHPTCGYPGRFQSKEYGMCDTKLTPIQQEIIQTYKKILDIVEPDLKPYIEKKWKIYEIKRIVSCHQTSIKKIQKKINEFEERIVNMKMYIERLNAKNKKLESELDSD